MKYLFLLSSVLRSHFDRNKRKFTLSAMLMFFFSSFLMLFVAAVLGSNILWSDKELDRANTTYSFYMHEKHSNGTYSDREAIEAGEYIFDTLFSMNSNSIDNIYVDIYNDFEDREKLGEKPMEQIGIMPVLRENYGNKLVFGSWFGYTSLTLSQAVYQAEQNIREGVGITLQQIDNEEYVIVVPEDCNIGVGEKAALFGETFSVVGITSDELVRIPSSVLEKLSYENKGLKYVITSIDFDKQMTDETYNTLKRAVFEASGKEIVGYRRHTYSNETDKVFTSMLGIFGTLIALFSVLGIYYPTVRLCKETTQMLSVFKLCGMRRLPVFGLLALSVLICYAISFGLASVVLILTEGFFSDNLLEYELKGIYFSYSALLFILVLAAAAAPQMIKLAKKQPSQEVEK